MRQARQIGESEIVIASKFRYPHRIGFARELSASREKE
jgi:hypothetical protein